MSFCIPHSAFGIDTTSFFSSLLAQTRGLDACGPCIIDPEGGDRPVVRMVRTESRPMPPDEARSPPDVLLPLPEAPRRREAKRPREATEAQAMPREAPKAQEMHLRPSEALR